MYKVSVLHVNKNSKISAIPVLKTIKKKNLSVESIFIEKNLFDPLFTEIINSNKKYID